MSVGARSWRVLARMGLQEGVAVVGAFLVYFAIRGAVVDRADEAMARGLKIIDWEKDWGIYHELWMQALILDQYWLIKVVNWVYFWGHMPLIVIVAVWLYSKHRETYRLARNSFLASGAIGLVGYWLFPVAPPRLIEGAGFVDTMALYDRVGYNAQETAAFVNQFAAVPSLHFGWSLLLGFLIGRTGKSALWWVLGAVWPVAMFFSVVMSGNHFIFDAIAGGAVSFAGLGVALWMERLVERRRADRQGGQDTARMPA